MCAPPRSHPRPRAQRNLRLIELRSMNMSCSASFLRLERDWKAEGTEGRLGRGAPGQAPGPQGLTWEPRVLPTWGALGRWVGDTAQAAGRVGGP